jgi:hypothetical protein
MHQLIKNEKQKAQMNSLGYAAFDFLNDDDIKWCQALFNEYPLEHVSSGFHVLTELPSFEAKLDLHQRLKTFLEPKLKIHFHEFTDHLYSMQIKYPGSGSTLVPHQDWSITNETTHRSYTLWIPLSDTYPENGGFHVIPGSHELFSNIRGANVPPPYKTCGNLLIDYMEPLEVPAGKGLLFDQGLLHYTPDNRTQDPRISIICTITCSDAELFRYFYNEAENTLEAYEFNELFWIKYRDFATERFQKPNTELKFSSKQLLPVVLDEQEVKSRLEEFKSKQLVS